MPSPSRVERALRAEPAYRLLLQAIRPSVDAARLVEAAGEIDDWDAVLAAASAHRVLPATARRLGSLAALPAPVREALRERAQRSAVRALRYAGHLQRLMTLWWDAGVRSLPLKGPALAAMLYGDVAARQFADLDVLVPVEDVEAAVRLLLADGFRQVAPARPFRPEDLPEVIRRFGLKDLSFVHRKHRIALELHWRPFKDPSIRLDFAPRWPEGARWPEPDPEAHALYVLHHGSNHGYRRLCWLADGAGLASGGPELDWHRIRMLAKSNGLETSAALGLLLAHRLLGSPVPDAFAPVLAARATRLAALADGCLAATPDYIEAGRERLAWMRGLDDRPIGRLRHTARYLLKPSAAEWTDGVGSARAVGRFTRPWALVRKLLRR